jgi:eukaryotic-like serine/threonine-protein kinase
VSEAVQNWRALYRLIDAALASGTAPRNSWLDALEPAGESLGPLVRRVLARRDLIESAAFLRSLPRFTHVPGAAFSIAAEVGDCVGPYRLQRLLGSGGMGSVWLASRTDGMPDHFALKLPHVTRDRVTPAEIVERERSILAALDHPQIVRAHDAGMVENGCAYLALQYVDGEHIDQYCAARRLGIAERLALILQITRILAHAHARNVIHRDLKPSNLLVDTEGRAHLVDFGIATVLGETTADSRAALTPSYASPEQLRAERPSVATDIYSLGVVLNELLTGSRQYERGVLSGALDAIVLKMLQQSPADRYASADELALDIERSLYS